MQPALVSAVVAEPAPMTTRFLSSPSRNRARAEALSVDSITMSTPSLSNQRRAMPEVTSTLFW